jgi:oxygen-independent coproporphyrinogen III oxidase
MATESAPIFAPELLQQLDINGPRYTSYPTADRFHAGFDAAAYAATLAARAELSRHRAAAPLSLYVHIPFCESLCYYCACNKVITRHHERAAEYLRALDVEIELHQRALGSRQRVSQLHFGGGSPTFLSDAELAALMASLESAFELTPDAELSIEVDPRTVDAGRLATLRHLGFNRISFGVQDFDPAVQKAVHREQSEAMVRGLVEHARALGFVSINTDLIFGLPLQTPASFARTVEQIGALRPDRIALYAYAHLPSRFKPQRRILSADLPLAGARVQMLQGAIEGFLGQGYRYIGMDHFALPDDALAVAQRQGRLHRNFQGYTTQPGCDLIGLGVSAIGGVGASYAQNAKTLPEYYAAMQEGRFAVVRGIALDAEDLLRRDVILELMCQGRVDFAAIEAAHAIAFREHFAPELARLAQYAAMGLVRIGAQAIEVTPTGWFFVRVLAMAFDAALAIEAPRERFSRVI